MPVDSNLGYYIREAFTSDILYTNAENWTYVGNNTPSVFMEIPLDSPVVEVPVLVFDNFVDCISEENCPDMFVVDIYSTNRTTRYVTVDRYMKDVLRHDFYSRRLVRLNCKQGDRHFVYYGSHGSVFDKDFRPLMMCSWLLEKQWYSAQSYNFKFLRPLLRISPDVYLQQSNPMEKWIVRKMLHTTMEYKYPLPYVGNAASHFPDYDERMLSSKIEIDDCPFNIVRISPPSFNVTNRELLEVARTHLDDLIQ